MTQHIEDFEIDVLGARRSRMRMAIYAVQVLNHVSQELGYKGKDFFGLLQVILEKKIHFVCKVLIVSFSLEI